MSKLTHLPLVSLAAVLAIIPAQTAAQGFDLPPSPTPSPSSSPAYGPQDPERPRARPIPVPTPSASAAARATPTPQPAPQPTAAVASAPTPQSQGVRPSPSAQPTTRAVPRRRPNAPQPTAIAPGAEPQRSPELQTPSPDRGTPAPEITPGLARSSQPATDSPQDGSGLPWLWIVLATLAILLAGAIAWLRKREVVGAISVPEIERPVPVKRAPPAETPETTGRPLAAVVDPAKVAPLAPAAKPQAVAFDMGPLHVAFETRNITATLMAVTLSYRITLSNRGDAPLGGILVGGTMEAANDAVAIERQLEPPLGQLPIAHQLETLGAGAVEELTGEIRVPLSQLRPIRRGQQVLFVPIARLRAAATPGDGEPVIAQQSVLLGITGQGPQLEAIRLDQGPRIYRDIGQRVIAPQAA